MAGGKWGQALDNTGGLTPPRDRTKMSTGRMRNKASEFFDNGIGSDIFWDQPISPVSSIFNATGKPVSPGLRQRAHDLINNSGPTYSMKELRALLGMGPSRKGTIEGRY